MDTYLGLGLINVVLRKRSPSGPTVSRRVRKFRAAHFFTKSLYLKDLAGAAGEKLRKRFGG